MLRVGALQPFSVDVSVNLGGRDIRMSQHDLDGPEVGSVCKEMAGKRVSQLMRGNTAFNSDGLSMGPQALPESLSGHCATEATQKNRTVRARIPNLSRG